MPPLLLALPNELTFNIVTQLSYEDVINLSRSCRGLYRFCHSVPVCKNLLQNTLPYCSELRSTNCENEGYVTAFRKRTKRIEAVSHAKPFTAAVLGYGMMFLYRQQCVCYVSNDDVRVLRLNQSPQTELVMSIPLVLEKTVIPKHGRMAGKFSLLHINEGILSCFYHYPSPKSGGNLLVIDTNRRSILLSSDLAESKDIWTRHSGDYIYCGVLVASTFLKRLEWILYTYDLKTGAFIDSHYWLQKLCGSKVNSEVCFEIIAGYFYGVSVLPALPQPGGAADISWHYWCVRFPIDREPDRQHVEEAPIFRRLQSHGPVDHRWTKLAIVADEVTGTPTIIETRKEWVDGGSDCPRTMYKTKIDFSQDFDPCLKVIRGSMNSSDDDTFVNCYHPIRASLDVHRDETGSNAPIFGISKTPFQCYNASASSFIDLVDSPLESGPWTLPHIRLRVSSTNQLSFTTIEKTLREDDVVQSLGVGGNIGGTDRLSHWPPNFTTGRENGQAAARLHAVLNPEKYQGEVYGVADDHCVVYSTGKRDCAKAFVLISFDPSIRLHNLEKGNSTTSTANDTFTSDLTDGTSWDTPKLRVETSIHLEAQRLAGAEVERSLTPRKRKRSPLICPGPEEAILHGQRHSSRTLLDAFWCEPAMYLRIRQGLDFSS